MDGIREGVVEESSLEEDRFVFAGREYLNGEMHRTLVRNAMIPNGVRLKEGMHVRVVSSSTDGERDMKIVVLKRAEVVLKKVEAFLMTPTL